jgi:hypothetical protein
VPSIGGGTNFRETAREANEVGEAEGIGVTVGLGVGKNVSLGEGSGVEDSCAKTSRTGRTLINNMKLTLFIIVESVVRVALV